MSAKHFLIGSLFVATTVVAGAGPAAAGISLEPAAPAPEPQVSAPVALPGSGSSSDPLDSLSGGPLGCSSLDCPL
ncbi:hypothetical protein NONO_c55270 [Nocardia nova SH22a]|uniref:Secreted protein n=1 Tax=Nocardia nova SH22a TaxID=1415166 RepID=W5TM19_9NOCA|nr:hypothetical protein [Nocardia nova]AHH20307.1 hypothetical protein NONO_c55270 [Nocardia nova SH22a]